MRYVYVSIILLGLAIGGCAIGPAPLKRFISPSQAAYDKANAYFQQRDYNAAIAAYERFIEDYPRHNLLPGAYLGLAWSYYLKGEYNKSLQALAKVRTKDEVLKAWVDKLSSACKTKLASVATTAVQLFNIPAFTNQDILKVEGTVPPGSRVSINEVEVTVKEGLFSQEISLLEGENIVKIEVTDKDGNVQAKESRVVLDTTPPPIEVVDAELDDLGYVTVKGVTEAGATVIAQDKEELFVSENGEFEGKVKLPRNLEIELVAQDPAGNVSRTVFSDTEYPDRPTGLRIRSVYGDSVDLEWNANLEEDIKGYNVYYSLAGEFQDQRYNVDVIEDTIYTMVGLESGKTYTIYLRAVDKMGNESLESWETLTVTIP
jgi:hypothetical protein